MRLSLALLPLLLAAAQASAQDADEVPTKKLVLHPAAAPSPALKYRLLPTLGDKRPGNAALLWQRAHSPEWFGPLRRYPDFDKIGDLLELPLAKLPREKAASFNLGGMMKEMDIAARRTRCDWEMLDRIREDGFGLLLPDVQGFRTYGQLLSMRTRTRLLDRDFDGAVHSLQTHMTLGRHVGEAPILINVLVGNAIIAMAVNDIEEMIQLRGAPNLFWALADFPRPVVPFRPALEGERLIIDVIFPGMREALKDPSRPPMTVDQMMLGVKQLMYAGEPEMFRRLPLTVMATRSYPRARQYLLEHGYTAERIEEMTVLQVSLMYAIVEYDRFFDDAARWYSQPPWIARAGFHKSLDSIKTARGHTPDISWLPGLIVPAMDNVHNALVRMERRLALLQTVEAIRIYAAGHDGALPTALSDITDLPIPLDPATGRPFQYTPSAGKALLVAPPPAGAPSNQTTTVRYELTVAPSK